MEFRLEYDRFMIPRFSIFEYKNIGPIVQIYEMNKKDIDIQIIQLLSAFFEINTISRIGNSNRFL